MSTCQEGGVTPSVLLLSSLGGLGGGYRSLETEMGRSRVPFVGLTGTFVVWSWSSQSEVSDTPGRRGLGPLVVNCRYRDFGLWERAETESDDRP